jgi:uncharacterized protein
MGGATTSEVVESLRRLKSDLARQFPIEHFIMFGSRARGDELLTSDVDVVIVSEGFRGRKFQERPAAALEYWDDMVDLEALCYSPSEFRDLKERLGIVKRALEEGIEL